jgi:hypothetical protein
MNNLVKAKELRAVFEEASKFVDGLPEVLKPKAFEIAVNQLLGGEPVRVPENSVTPLVVPSVGEDSDFFSKLQKYTGVENSLLKTIYRIDKDKKLRIVISLSGGNSDKQKQLAYLYLLGRMIGFENEWIPSADLFKLMKEYGIHDNNESKNLKNEKGNILNNNKEYNLTPNGLTHAKELTKTLTTQAITPK